MGYVLRILLPAAVALVLAAAPAVAATPRAHTAAQKRAFQALHEVEALRDGQGVRTGRELTEALRELANGTRHLRGEARERAIALLSRPTDGDAPDDERFDRPETTPACSEHFCVHFVTGGADVATTPYVNDVLSRAEEVYQFENGTLAWHTPPGDAPLGGDGHVDIYLKDLAPQKLFGFAATDPLQDTKSQYSYLVLDNDFLPAQYGAPAIDSLRLTLAHEYGHVLQYGYDVMADGWHYESSAVWLEHRFDPALADWVNFVQDRPSGAGWRSLTELPLTAFDDPADQPRNAKPYGSVVWNHFLTSRYGPDGDRVQRLTWEMSDGYQRPSTHSYDSAITAVGGKGFASDFAAFSAATAEWRFPASGFALPSLLPDVERRGTLAIDGQPTSTVMDHLTFALYDVATTSAPRIRLVGDFPTGTYGAIALVARPGTAGIGQVTTELAELPAGGMGGVTLDQPASFTDGGGRVTAVVVNADASERGFGTSDWAWTRDDQAVSARIATDLTGPVVTGRTPGRSARRVRTDAAVRVTFSKAVSGVNAKSFSLRRPNGRAVPAVVGYANASRTATLTPVHAMSDTTRYTVRLTDAIVDASANPLAVQRWTFTTVRRGPRASVRVTSQTARAVQLLLRSADADRLGWTARLVAGGRTIARRSGALRPGRALSVAVPSKGHRSIRLVVDLRDPQGNRRHIERRLG